MKISFNKIFESSFMEWLINIILVITYALCIDFIFAEYIKMNPPEWLSTILGIIIVILQYYRND